MIKPMDNDLVGYLIEPDDMRKLREIEQQLHGGTDHERDLGHRIWLILNKAEPVEQKDLK